MLEGLRGEDRIAELCRREGWSADEASKTLIVRNEGGLFSNQVGTESKRSVTVGGDQLRIATPRLLPAYPRRCGSEGQQSLASNPILRMAPSQTEAELFPQVWSRAGIANLYVSRAHFVLDLRTPRRIAEIREAVG